MTILFSCSIDFQFLIYEGKRKASDLCDEDLI